MLTLALLRHAKSSWDDPTQDDFDRQLNERGRAAAPVAGTTIAKAGVKPSLIVCSSARRTRETLELARPRMGLAPSAETVTDDKLYLASPLTLLEVLRDLPDTHKTVLMVGHNPGLHELAVSLVGHGTCTDLADMQMKFPTASLVVMHLQRSRWRDVRPGDGRLDLFWYPKKGA